MEENMTAAIRKATIVNKNANLRLSQEQRTCARDKTHEQRKPKKKRKDIGEHTTADWSEQSSSDAVKQKKISSNENSKFHRSNVQVESKSYLSHRRTKITKAFEKILQPRAVQRSICVIQPVAETKIQVVVTCYPLSGASYSNPLLPREEMSFPTQVSEQQELNTDEIVFSNGRSIKLDTLNQPQDERNMSNVEAGIVSHSKQTDQHQNQQGNNQFNFNDKQITHRRPPRPPRYPEYIEYDQRLKSFARWWKRYPDPTTLCNAGFFFTNDADLVRCYQCGIGLKDFSHDDNPLNEHVKHSGDCPYLKEYLGLEGLANIKSQVQTKNQEEHNKEQNFQKPASTMASVYRHPEYQSFHVRLSSFDHWPRSLMQKPEQLAEAGLYYTGSEDQVRCFACDGGLKKWDPQDDPWIEHCRWFPECPYVREQKGEEYIGLVQATAAMEIQERLGNEEVPTTNNTSSEIAAEMERLALKDPEMNAAINEHRETCIEMGYSERDFNIAAKRLAREGNDRPTLEEILDTIEAAERAEIQTENHKNETPIEENVRLKSMLFCMTCGVNAVNSLFLPCTHHRMCMTCAKQLASCPVCDRHIRQKTRTYLV